MCSSAEVKVSEALARREPGQVKVLRQLRRAALVLQWLEDAGASR